MGQRFHYCHQDKRREIEIGYVDLISMRLEVASHKCIALSDVSLDIFKPPNTWDLFREDAMQLGIDAVSVDPSCDEFARRVLERARRGLDQGAARRLGNFLRMAIDTAATSASLLGKYWYNEPILTPATSAIRLVLARS